MIWRCHIDTSEPHPLLWRALLPYINQCAGVIFTQPEFAGHGLQKPAYEITPCIDFLAEKTRKPTLRRPEPQLSP